MLLFYLAFLDIVVRLTGRDNIPSIIKSVSRKSLNSLETKSKEETSSSPFFYKVFISLFKIILILLFIPLFIFLNNMTLSVLETGRIV